MVRRNPHREKRTRKPPSLAVKLACCIVELGLVDREDAKAMDEHMILSLVQFDHVVLHAFDGTDHPTNFTPRLILNHREKTAKTDAPAVAKHDRIAPAEIEFRKRLLAKAGQDVVLAEKKRSQWPKGQKIRSKGFPKRNVGKPPNR